MPTVVYKIIYICKLHIYMLYIFKVINCKIQQGNEEKNKQEKMLVGWKIITTYKKLKIK